MARIRKSITVIGDLISILSLSLSLEAPRKPAQRRSVRSKPNQYETNPSA
jgi:hypothetical protein